MDTVRTRLTWLDLARGFAVISMIIAHTSPWGGVLNVTEYLTAPWFALLVGMSLQLAWEKADGRAGVFLLGSVARGILLIVAGELLQRVYNQIDVVLQTLGLLTIVLAPVVVLVGRRWRWRMWASIAVVMAFLSPILMESARGWLADGGWHTEWLAWVADLAATGARYRATTFVAIAAAGIAALPLLRSRWGTGRRALALAVGLTTAAGVVYAAGKASPWGADAYSGSTPEIVGAILLSLAATFACAWIASSLGEQRVRAWLGAVVDTGRMAFTAYSLQVLALAVITRIWLPGQRDDHWAVMLGVIALCVLTSWAWLRVFPIGPLEAVLRLPAAVLVRLGSRRGV